MNAHLSKPIQRLLALALAFIVLLFAITGIMHPLWQATQTSLDALTQSRFANARMTNLANEVALLNPEQVRAQSNVLRQNLFVAPNEAAAAGAMQAHLTRLFAGQAFESLWVRPDGRLLRGEIRVSGKESDVLAALARLDASTPLVSIDSLRVSAKDVEARTVGLVASVSAQWQRP
jgi:hypothetical protein